MFYVAVKGERRTRPTKDATPINRRPALVVVSVSRASLDGTGEEQFGLKSDSACSDGTNRSDG